MRPVRDLFSDLVERRLWPVALLLVVALVAVPFVLAKSPADQPAATPVEQPEALAAAATAPDPPLVTVAGEAPQDAPLRGRSKNPFRQQYVPPPPSQETSGEPAPASDAGATGGGDPAPGGDADGGDTAPPAKTFVRAAIDVRFGKAIGSKRTIEDVPRLTPLPSARTPIVIFLGMRKDHETAVFMISSDVHAQGDGTCVPSRKHCEAIELKEGDVAFLDVAAADGRVTQYELELVAVTLQQTTSKADADAAYARVSRAGERILRRRAAKAANVTGRPFRLPFRYAAKSGVLHVAPWVVRELRRREHAHGATAGAVEAVADARDVPAG
jgi:hypothetical protein